VNALVIPFRCIKLGINSPFNHVRKRSSIPGAAEYREVTHVVPRTEPWLLSSLQKPRTIPLKLGIIRLVQGVGWLSRSKYGAEESTSMPVTSYTTKYLSPDEVATHR
jgi:hypothetical protein